MAIMKHIDAVMLREMVNAGAALLEKNRDAVNALNVFPVPDGDTGTNMSMTMMSAVKEINAKEFATAGEAAAALAKGALRGARGNSGVILSQLFRGFSKSLEGLETISPVDFANAVKNSADAAYKAVMKPKEGTILTVARVIGEDAVRQAAQAPDDFEALMRLILQSGERILAKTQDMLPALKQAGVVDAGGRGLLLVYSGYAAVMRGEKVEDALVDMSGDVSAEQAFVDDHDAIEEIKFAYCTEFFIQNLKENTMEADIAGFRRRLNRIGDCVLVVGDLSLVKVHVHTNDPGKALQYGCQLGELVNLKIENMLQQSRDKQANEKKQPAKKYGAVSVSLGKGFSQIFKDLGVDAIVDGGQTMNPSIEDLQKAVEAVNAEHVFILPNNGNITLAAKQVAELSEKKVIVLETKNVAMGIAALIAFNEEATPEENEETMMEAAVRVRTGTVTFAVRDTQIDGLSIKQGDMIGLNNGQVTVTCNNAKEAALTLMEQIVTEDDSLITVYYGEDTTEEDAAALAQEIGARYSACDVEVHQGGQPLYYYLLSVE